MSASTIPSLPQNCPTGQNAADGSVLVIVSAWLAGLLSHISETRGVVAWLSENRAHTSRRAVGAGSAENTHGFKSALRAVATLDTVIRAVEVVCGDVSSLSACETEGAGLTYVRTISLR